MDTATEPALGVDGHQRVDNVSGVSESGGSWSPTPNASEARVHPSTADQQGLEDAYTAYRSELTGLARRALGSAHLAEEAVQETFARAWRSRHRFDASRGSLRTWLYSIERNLLVDMARTRQRQEVRDARLGGEADLIDDHVESTIASWQVEEAVRQLSTAHRTIVVEMYFKGRTSKEMADRLAVPEGTVRSRLFYALKAMKLTLEEMGWNE